MGRRTRATASVAAERHADELAGRLGAALKDARKRQRLTQAVAAARAGIAQVTWGRLERTRDGRYTLATWDRAAHAVGGRLSAYVEGASAADEPRDAVHLRNQELVLRTALSGGWRGVPEQALDRDLTRSRHGDVVLHRRRAPIEFDEWCLVEVVDWLADVGESTRDFDRRLAALDRWAVSRMHGEVAPPRTSGVWLLRATRRNRQLVNEHGNYFRGRFLGSGRAWLAALSQPAAAMPTQAVLLWVDVRGKRIFAARMGGGGQGD